MWKRAMAVAIFRRWFTDAPIIAADGEAIGWMDMSEGWQGGAVYTPAGERWMPKRPGLEVLRGKDLVCWCPLDQPCHADVLLELLAVVLPPPMLGLP